MEFFKKKSLFLAAGLLAVSLNVNAAKPEDIVGKTKIAIKDYLPVRKIHL